MWRETLNNNEHYNKINKNDGDDNEDDNDGDNDGDVDGDEDEDAFWDQMHCVTSILHTWDVYTICFKHTKDSIIFKAAFCVFCLWSVQFVT